ncbi:MAG: hypothetical protein LBO65_00020 [Spirochaetaceae bacterium]|jgi:hypothetical protein|nr:hypothetical protein [Spirochaetaceae bacterium]
MNNFDKDERYQFLLNYFPDNIIFIRFRTLLSDTITILKKLGITDKVRIDLESFKMMILDYFTDIARLKDFQNIEHTNVQKIYGYMLYWFLRRHPIQIIQEFPSSFDINERVAIALFLPRILKEAGIDPHKPSGKTGPNFINLLFYNMKYRHYTQQSLELMIEAFLTGHHWGA